MKVFAIISAISMLASNAMAALFVTSPTFMNTWQLGKEVGLTWSYKEDVITVQNIFLLFYHLRVLETRY